MWFGQAIAAGEGMLLARPPASTCRVLHDVLNSSSAEARSAARLAAMLTATTSRPSAWTDLRGARPLDAMARRTACR